MPTFAAASIRPVFAEDDQGTAFIWSIDSRMLKDWFNMERIPGLAKGSIYYDGSDVF
jgi:hypothetical protein